VPICGHLIAGKHSGAVMAEVQVNARMPSVFLLMLLDKI
jgi:hypothetical protein